MSKRSRRFGCLLSIPTVAVVVFAGWWMMVRMPGQSYRGELATLKPDEASLGDALRKHVDHLAVAIGERNLRHYPALVQAAEYIEAELARVVAGIEHVVRYLGDDD